LEGSHKIIVRAGLRFDQKEEYFLFEMKAMGSGLFKSIFLF